MNTEIRFVLAIVLVVGVLVATNLVFPPVPAQPPSPAGDSASAAGLVDSLPEARAVPRPDPAGVALPGAVSDTATLRTDEPERVVVVEGPLYRHVLSTRGARLVSAELLRFRSFTRPGPVQLIPDSAAGVFGARLQVGRDTLDLRDASFTASREAVPVVDSVEQITFRHDGPGLVVEITYHFRPDSYLIDVTGSVRGIERPLLLVDLGGGLELNDQDRSAEARALAYVGNHLREGIRQHPLSGVDEAVVEEGPFLWAAFKSRFFVIAVLPGARGAGPEHLGGLLVRPTAPDRVEVTVTEAVGGDGRFGYRAFVGPQEYARLTALGTELDEVNPYGWRWIRPVIRPVVGVIFGVLAFLHDTLNLGYGWVLVVFGVVMRVVLWPFNQKAMRAQLRNAAVQPLLQEIQKKYKDKPEKLQQEMLRLYKEHGFNPMAGCLPMLLPWPILIALFFVFQNTIEFRGVPFIWLPDLSAPDPIYILPIFLGASMFLMQWIATRSMPPNPQMQMMMYMMPAMMIFIFWRMPAGVNLYYAVTNLATIPQQIWIAKERRKVQPQAPPKNQAP
jgi:YidC/Oxa1 family membrane protein insertase